MIYRQSLVYIALCKMNNLLNIVLKESSLLLSSHGIN
uniref:Bm14219 n=1 Tax=Brugia malayi TaxID=6279 RepID=A0A1I9G2R5_BRUMA|nr:Bm14219 [Brugia malayi]